MAHGAPIQNLDSIDIIGARNEGGADLTIVVSSALNASPEHQKLLLDKLEGYLGYVNTPDFAAEFGIPSPDRVCIVLACYHSPDPVILRLIEKCSAWAQKNNASLRVENRTRAG